MSGTGNSYRMAQWMKEFAQPEIHTIKCITLDDATLPGEEILNDHTLVGILFPVHGFMPPWSMLKFLARMRRQKGVPCFCVATRGGLPFGPLTIPGIAGLGTFLAALIMFIKGYRPRALFSMDMPSNFINFHWGLHKRNVEKISQKSRLKTQLLVAQMLQGKNIFLSLNNLWEAGWGIIILWAFPIFPIIYLLVGKLFMAKVMFANNSCNSCGICAKFCPNQAIRMTSFAGKKRPFWTYHCEVCLRCMGYCHKGAVEAGHSWAAILYYLTTIPLLTFGLSKVNSSYLHIGEPNFLVLYDTISVVNTIAGILLSYWFFWLLIRIPIVNTIFSYSSLTHYYRRYHEPETKLKDLSRHIFE